MNDYGKLRVVRGEPILAKGYNSKGPLSESHSQLNEKCHQQFILNLHLPPLNIVLGLVSNPFKLLSLHHRKGEQFEVKGYETGERVKVFNLRVFLRVKMLNILGNLRVSHQ